MDIWHDVYLDDRTTIRFRESEELAQERFIESLEADEVPFEIGPEYGKYDRRVFVMQLMSRSEVLKRALTEFEYICIHAATNFENNTSASFSTRGRSVHTIELNSDYL